MRLFASVTASVLLISACSTPEQNNFSSSATADVDASGLNLSAMSCCSEPGEDFYEFANGAWEEATEIPAGAAFIGSYSMLSRRAADDIAVLMVALSADDPSRTAEEQFLGDLYASWMDTRAVELRGLSVLQTQHNLIGEAETHEDIWELFQQPNFPSPMALVVGADRLDPSEHALYIVPDGILLPDRRYYVSQEEQYVSARVRYVEYISSLLDIAGFENSAQLAAGVLDIEVRLAAGLWTQERIRSDSNSLVRIAGEEVNLIAPGVDVDGWVRGFGVESPEFVWVSQREFFDSIAETFRETDLITWQAYLTAHMYHEYASYLPEEIRVLRNEMFDSVFSGTVGRSTRERDGISMLTRTAGDLVGQVFATNYFGNEARDNVTEIALNVRQALSNRLSQTSWMDASTRASALSKLSSVQMQIGFPTTAPPIPAVNVRRDSLFQNIWDLNAFEFQENLDLLGQSVDIASWPFPPQIAGAMYSNSANRITIPAAVLRPPFYDPNADAAVNYGAIGTLIGHELTHAFDDRGRRFDAQGAFSDWWSESSAAQFSERVAPLIDQYNGYEVLPGRPLSGRISLNENIADIGGMIAAFDAYQSQRAECCDGEVEVIGGFTPEQRFFLAWAQTRQQKYSEENLLRRITSVAHAPARYRTNGNVAHIQAWYDAFDIVEEDPLFIPENERVVLWGAVSD